MLRAACHAALPAFALLCAAGCAQLGDRLTSFPSPTEAGLNTPDLIDPPAQAEGDRLFDGRELHMVAERVREVARPPVLPPKRSVLVLSGGGNYGAYTAGVLAGWSRCGRPDFDVVTGISTGAIIAPLAFLGPKYDPQLQEFYTTLQNDDLYRVKKSVRALIFSDALADTRPLERKVEATITPELVAEIAAEHAKGRRLYVGTTELDSKRFVVWDVGAVASRGRPEDVGLIRRIILGSSAIPGFFPPQKINVAVDGELYTERHIDGGANVPLFFRPPYVPPGAERDPVAASLYDTDLYILVAGKLFPDPDVVRRRALVIAGTSVSSVLYAQTRSELQKLFTLSLLTGMNYHATAISAEFPAPKSSTEFNPEEMTAMFNEGVRRVRDGTVWRRTPPGAEPGETPLERAGPVLTRVPRSAPQPVQPSLPDLPPAAAK